MRINIYETEVLIVGGGMAAARAAIEAGCEGATVALVAKGPVGKSGASTMAGGALAAVAEGTGDDPEVHCQDTVAAGRGLTNKELARILAREGSERLKDLVEWGVRFPRKDGAIEPRQAPGHSYPRSRHALGGGVAYMLPLRRKALSYPNVSLHEDVMALKLLLEGGRVVGALCYDIRAGELVAVLAGAAVLATGGYQDLYPLSSASVDMTGDGYALAFEAGAELVDMEILLYYPTALVSPRSLQGTLMLYEYILKHDVFGARLVNAFGEDLLDQYNPLPVRDVLARRIFEEVRSGKGTERGGVYMDMGRSPRAEAERKQLLKEVGPSLVLLASIGIDVVNGKIEVAPAAHTVLGGVRIDARCQTTVPGLFAAGEVSGNVHGANRLGANALTETQVFGRRAGLFGTRYAKEAPWPRVSDSQIADAARSLLNVVEPKESPADPTEIKGRIRETMLECAGPAKDEKGLLEGIRRITAMVDSDLPPLCLAAGPGAFNYQVQEAMEVRMMATTARMVCHAALIRRESRGHHYRSDYPKPDDSRPPYRTRVRLQDGDLVADICAVS
ncbi:MAG: FAD-binding protein [Chloroflexi bacterium]|nr:FAD-binding protein [Chloroflexota bacterium]